MAEAAIVPAPDPVRLAVPKAYVALAAGHEPTRETALAILGFALDHLPPYLRIRRLEFVDLPKTISGKIRRVELRQREDDAAHAGASATGEFRYEDFEELRTRRVGPRTEPLPDRSGVRFVDFGSGGVR